MPMPHEKVVKKKKQVYFGVISLLRAPPRRSAWLQERPARSVCSLRKVKV